MNLKDFVKKIKESNYYYYFIKIAFNRYFIVFFVFLVRILFIDESNLLLQRDLDNQIAKLEKEKNYFKDEYDQNDSIYRKLHNNNIEKEKYARENYFMKKENEDIFILVVDSSNTKKNKE